MAETWNSHELYIRSVQGPFSVLAVKAIVAGYTFPVQTEFKKQRFF